VHEARQQLLRSAALLGDTRKLPPLVQLVQPGGALDIAASHARALQTAADELFRANASLALQRVPLFNVPDALDVLSTGGPQEAECEHWGRGSARRRATAAAPRLSSVCAHGAP
jgi:hypothetical protein